MKEKFSGFIFNNQVAICDDEVIANLHQATYHRNNCSNDECPMKRVKQSWFECP